MKLSILNQRGHAHFALPVLAILAVAGIGTYLLGIDNAQTPACGQMQGTFQQVVAGKTATSPYNKDGNGTHCVQYIQQMLNGSFAHLIVKGGPGIPGTSVKSINSTPLSQLGSANFDVKSGFASVSDKYDSSTTSDMQLFQDVMNDFFNNKTYEPDGVLPTNGETGSSTWYALCRYTSTVLDASRTNDSTDYSNGSKTTMWYLRSYMRAGYTASTRAGCKAVLNPPKTTKPTPTPTKSAPKAWALTGVTSVKESGATVTFTSTIENTGNETSASFQYGPRYFYSATSDPTHAANAGYPGEKLTVANQTRTLENGTIFTLANQQVTIDPTQGKYLCGTVAFSPDNSSGATNGRSVKAACVSTALPWSLSGTTTATVTSKSTPITAPVTVQFSSTVKNAGPGSATFEYGFRYFTYIAHLGVQPTLESGGVYVNEAIQGANQNKTLTNGTDFQATAPTVTIARPNPNVIPVGSSEYVCGIVVFPLNNVSAAASKLDSMSKVACAPVPAS